MLILCLLLFPTFLFAQLKKDTQVNMAQALTKPNKIQSIVGLLGLDPNKFSMSHSYSLSFTTFGGNSYNYGLYLNTMKYRLADPLTMYMQIGFQHQPFGSGLGNGPLNNEIFISGAGMEYKPSENFKVQFRYSQRPSAYYYSPYHDPITRNRAWFDKKTEDREDK